MKTKGAGFPASTVQSTLCNRAVKTKGAGFPASTVHATLCIGQSFGENYLSTRTSNTVNFYVF
jgi:hypothetical protein